MAEADKKTAEWDEIMAKVPEATRESEDKANVNLARHELDADPSTNLHDLSDVDIDLDGELPEIPALLRGPDEKLFLSQGDVGIFVAPGGFGKSRALAQLLFSIATGTPWLGTFKPSGIGKVAMCFGEEKPDRIYRRLIAAYQGLKKELPGDIPPQDEIKKNISFLSLRGLNARFQNDDNTPSDFYFKLRQALKNKGPFSLIILDPASRFMGRKAEIDNALATDFMSFAERLTEDLDGNPTVVVTHHANKGAIRGKSDQSSARGSSALIDAPRWASGLERFMDSDEEKLLLPEHMRSTNYLRFINTKNNDGPRCDPIYLKMIDPGYLITLDYEELGFLKEAFSTQHGDNIKTPKKIGKTSNYGTQSKSRRCLSEVIKYV